MENLNYWHDKDMGPYEKGKDSRMDKIVDDIADCMIDKFFKSKSENECSDTDKQVY